MDQRDDDKDHRTILARRGRFAVELCDCGQLHVTVGMTTLRLTLRDGQGLLDTLAEGIGRLEGHSAPAVH